MISAALKYYLNLAITTFDHFTSGPKRLFLKNWRMHIFIITFFFNIHQNIYSVYFVFTFTY